MRALHQLALRRAGKEQTARESGGLQLAHERQAGFARVFSSPAAESAKTTTSAPAAAWSESAPVTGTLKLSTGPDCRMSSAFALRDRSLGSMSRTSATRLRAGELVRERPAERSGANDRDDRHPE